MNDPLSIFNRFAGKGIYPHQLAWILLLPLRNLYLSPRTLAERLELEPEFQVLEIGCGPGYFSPCIAKKLPYGKLFLTDIQPEMIQKSEKRLKNRQIRNVDLRISDGTALPYKDSSFDRIFLVTVLGEISNATLAAKEMFRVLRPGGKVSISEQAGDPDSLTLEEVAGVLCPAGFTLDRVYGRKRTFTVNFIK